MVQRQPLLDLLRPLGIIFKAGLQVPQAVADILQGIIRLLQPLGQRSIFRRKLPDPLDLPPCGVDQGYRRIPFAAQGFAALLQGFHDPGGVLQHLTLRQQGFFLPRI